MPRKNNSKSTSNIYDLWGHTGLDIEIPEDDFSDEAWRTKKDVLFDLPEH